MPSGVGGDILCSCISKFISFVLVSQDPNGQLRKAVHWGRVNMVQKREVHFVLKAPHCPILLIWQEFKIQDLKRGEDTFCAFFLYFSILQRMMLCSKKQEKGKHKFEQVPYKDF